MNNSLLDKKAILISTPIFYPNAKPHIGHLYTLALTGAWKDVRKLLGKSTIISSGIDAHGQKVQMAAEAVGRSVMEYVDDISQDFLHFFNSYDIYPDLWVNTTKEEHKIAVQHVWMELYSKGYIYKHKYVGWYSISDEHYLPIDKHEEYLNNPNPKIIWKEEECYYFKLSALQQQLKEFYLKNQDLIYPNQYYKEVMSFIEQGLTDFAISRPKERLTWGIEVPNDKDHIIYVWIDALVNYLSVIGYPDIKYLNYWPSYNIIGKDILKFHAIYWIAILIALEIPAPKRLIVHGWILNGQDKISKSLNNAVNLDVILNSYSKKLFKFYLIRSAKIGDDSEFTKERIKDTINVISNKYGNLILRLFGIFEIKFNAHFGESIEEFQDETIEEKLNNFHQSAIKFSEDITCMSNYLESFEALFEELNLFVTRNALWNYLNLKKLENILFYLFDVIKKASILISPIFPDETLKMAQFFDYELNFESYYADIKKSYTLKPPVFFPKTIVE